LNKNKDFEKTRFHLSKKKNGSYYHVLKFVIIEVMIVVVVLVHDVEK
jgi:hypothetical protein